MSTGESKAAEQARLRRERREKKILAQGNSRLEKIAGLQGGATAREALHPELASSTHDSIGPVADPPEPDIADLPASTTSSSIRSSELQSSHAHSPNRSPGMNLFGVDGGDEDPFNMLRGENDPFANMPEELKNDPMMKLLLNMGGGARAQSSGAGRGMLGNSENSSSDDLNNLAEKITKQFLGARTGQGSQEQMLPPDTSAWKWKLARIISVLTVLGFLWGQLEDYHFSREFDISYGIVPLISECI
jgi:GET complex subunit GET2